MTFPQCDLCNTVSLDVRPGVAEYPDGYRFVQRCADHGSCMERVRANGEEWPLTKVPVEETA